MKLSKESKIRILENFYAIDYVIFGKLVNKIDSCCQAERNDYTSTKGAILSVLVEMFKLIEHSPESLTEIKSGSDLAKIARGSAQTARENCEKLVATPKGRDDIKVAIRNSVTEGEDPDLEELVKTKIREKAFALAIDNLLIARTISESKDYKKLNTWEGKLLEDAYKVLRDSLVEVAISILENVQ